MTTSTRDLTSEVTSIRDTVDKLRTEQARAEARLSAAEEEHSRLLARLRTEFGVESLEAAQQLLSELDKQIMTEMNSVREQLSLTGSSE